MELARFDFQSSGFKTRDWTCPRILEVTANRFDCHKNQSGSIKRCILGNFAIYGAFRGRNRGDLG